MASPSRCAHVAIPLLLVWTLASGVAVAADTTNLVVDGGFETATDPVPSGWTQHAASGGRVQIVTGTDQVHSGGRAVLLAPKAEPRNSSTFLFSDRIEVERGKRYRAKAWAKGKGAFALGFYQYSPKGGWLRGGGLGVVGATDQWRPHSLYYGNPPDDIGFVAVLLQVHGAGNEVCFDDVSFEVVALPAGAEGPPNGAVAADRPARGVAEGWAGPAQRMAIESDGRGGYCQRFDAGLLADDVRGDLKEEDAFNYRLASAVQPPAWASFSCDKFPVEPGTTYQIGLRLQARAIHTFHIKLRFFDLDGAPYSVGSGVRPYSTLGGTRDGTWAYQRLSCQATSPTDAGQAQIEFWCRCGGGTMWVDDLTVRSVLSPPVHPSHVATRWREDGDSVPAVPPSARRIRSAPAASPPPQSTVNETADAIDVALTNGVRLRVHRKGHRVLGIGAVSIGSVYLRNAQAPFMAPLVETTDGGEYVQCRYVGHEIGGSGQVMLRTELRDGNGRADRLTWHIAPHHVDVAGVGYDGLATWYTFSSRENGVLQIVERATWELGGSPVGLTVVDQNSYAGKNVFLLGERASYCTGSGVRFVSGECLDYQFAPEGALFAYFREPCYVRYQRMGTPEFVIYRDAHQFAGEKEVVTTPKYVLWAERGDRDLWARARDFAYARARGQAGVVRETPLPLTNVWTDWREMAKIGKSAYYQKIIDEFLPAIADCAFRRILVHETWEHGGCSPADLVINPVYGGEAALKKLCDAAQAQDIAVIAWYGPGHLWGRTPLFEQRPEFLLKGRDGKPPTTYCWPDITGVDLTGPWFEYAIGKLRGIRERTGLGGFWLDSYTNFTHGVKCATRELEIAQGDALIRFHAAIQQLGYITYTEASSDFGIKANGLPVGGLDSPTPSWPAPDELYDTSPYAGSWKEEYELQLAEGFVRDGWYFKALANRCVPFVHWRRFRDKPAWQRELAAANRAYNAAVPYMHVRQLLPDGAGVLWTSADGKVQILFAFTSQTMDLPDRKVVLLPDATPVEATEAGRFGLQAGKAYALR